MVVVGEATTGEEVIALAESLQSDVILMNIKMPGLNGIEATRRIVQTNAQIEILVITMFEDDDSVFAAVRVGARGYLLKGAAQTETLRAIRAVANGEAIFGPTIAERVMHYFTRRSTHASAPPTFPELTNREYEILTLIAQRRTNAEIAAKLVLSPKTVRNHGSSPLSVNRSLLCLFGHIGDTTVSGMWERFSA